MVVRPQCKQCGNTESRNHVSKSELFCTLSVPLHYFLCRKAYIDMLKTLRRLWLEKKTLMWEWHKMVLIHLKGRTKEPWRRRGIDRIENWRRSWRTDKTRCSLICDSLPYQTKSTCTIEQVTWHKHASSCPTCVGSWMQHFCSWR